MLLMLWGAAEPCFQHQNYFRFCAENSCRALVSFAETSGCVSTCVAAASTVLLRAMRPLAGVCSHLQSLAATRVAASGCKWLQVAASGCKWLQVAASGCKWLQVANTKMMYFVHAS